MKDSVTWTMRTGAAAVPPLPSSQGAAAERSEWPRRSAPLFRWSWKLVTLAGIDVYIHGTFLVLLAFVAMSGLLAGQGAAAMVRGTLLILAVFTTVSYGDVLKGPAESDKNLSVREAMRGEVETASPSEALDGAVTRIHQGEGRVLMVMEHDEVIGLLTAGNIGELLTLEAASRQSGSGARGSAR